MSVATRRRVGAAALVVAAVAAAVPALAQDNGPDPAPAGGGGGGGGQGATTTTVPVERTDLVERETVDGTLAFADSAPLQAVRAGTLTAAVREGSTVRRGDPLYELDGRAAAWLLYGKKPAWRALGPGIADGEDIRQLERNLRRMGHDPGTVDDDWTSATTAAVKRFQDARGLTEDGSLDLGEIVFRPGAARIGEAKAQLGDRVGAGAPVLNLSSRQRIVELDLDATRQDLASAGDEVTVELPTGRTVEGTIDSVGKVAQKSSSETRDVAATIPVEIRLRGKAGHGTALDQAPASVGLVAARARDVLAVPVRALLARPGGGYAVEVAGRGLVAVEPGVFAGDQVAVEGNLREGEQVVIAE